eukprot:1140980-Pelagomonas_calceolata.AAC.2
MGLPASVDALQSSKNLGMRCSDVARTPQDLVSINRGEVIATRSIEPNSKPPKKRKRSRYRASITPLVYQTQNLFLNATHSNVLPPSPDMDQRLGTLLTPCLEMPPPSELTCLAYKQSSLQMDIPASAHALQKGTTPNLCPNSVARASQESKGEKNLHHLRKKHQP